jgi:hypothetical protein
MILKSDKNIHWDYYIVLENDMEKVARYIEFDESNFRTYSIELAHLLLAASSEVDVVMKELCNYMSPESKANNINDYRKIIKENNQGIIKQKVICDRYGLTLTPWSSWEADINPSWWQSYNKVKHQRSIHFDKATLENVLNSIAGLLIANIHLNHDIFCAKHRDYPYDLRQSIVQLYTSSNLFKFDDVFLGLWE